MQIPELWRWDGGKRITSSWLASATSEILSKPGLHEILSQDKEIKPTSFFLSCVTLTCMALAGKPEKSSKRQLCSLLLYHVITLVQAFRVTTSEVKEVDTGRQ